MAAAYPVAGSAYTYVREAIDGRVGFLVGWATLLDYFFLPMVIWLIGGAYLQAEFPGVPFWVWILGFIVLTTALNIRGIKTAERVNDLLMLFQFLVIAFFVLLSLRYVVQLGGAGALADATPFANHDTTLAGISAGAAIAAHSSLGFDAVTTLTEETLVAAVFLAGLVVAQFASGISAQASTSRLLLAMGRDSVLPRRTFGWIHPRLRTPVFNILLTGAVGLIALRMNVATSTSFINFTAFTAFTFVNLSVLATYLRSRRAGERPRVLPYVIAPVIGAGVDIWLLAHLDSKAQLLGLIWLALGIAYLTYLTKGFRRPPPKMDLTEDSPASATA